MALNFRPDPYDGFKSDVERRLALNVRVVCRAVVAVVVALASAPSSAPSSAWEALRAVLVG